MRYRNALHLNYSSRLTRPLLCSAMIGMGGSVFVSSGRSDDGTSGAASIETSPSGPNGVSGAVRIASGSSTAGDSGAMFVGTGDSKFGAGGTVRIRVGDAGFKDGGDAILQAGQASAQGAKGGSVVLAGGEGSSTHTTDGGEASSFAIDLHYVRARLTTFRRRWRWSHDQGRRIKGRQSK